MEVNKVTYGDNTLIDLTEDTVTEDTLLEGATAHNAKGERITGKAVAGDMFTSVYDTDNNGQVDKADDADKLGGKTPDHYASKEDIPSLEGYATENYVENAIKEIPEVDLSNYATKGEIPTKVSELENDEGYLTEHQSLEGYAKKEEIPTVPTKVSAFENDKGYLTEHQSLEAYAKKEEIPAIPTKVSDLENDKGYLTQHQSLADYAKKSEIPTVPTKVSAFENDIRYAKKSEIPTIPSSLPANGGNADTIDGYHIDVAFSAPTEADFSVITFVL